jgi:hypothetical protein
MTNHSLLEKVSALSSLVDSFKESCSFHALSVEQGVNTKYFDESHISEIDDNCEKLLDKLIAVTVTGLANPKLFDVSKDEAIELVNELKKNVVEAKDVFEKANESFRTQVSEEADGIIPCHTDETSPSSSEFLSELIDYINEELGKIDDAITAIEACESLDSNKFSYQISIQQEKLDALITDIQRRLDSEVEVEDHFEWVDSDLEEIETEIANIFDDNNKPEAEASPKTVQVENKSAIDLDSLTQKIVVQLLNDESFKRMIKEVIASIRG